jgi:hypothetical protein
MRAVAGVAAPKAKANKPKYSDAVLTTTGFDPASAPLPLCPDAALAGAGPSPVPLVDAASFRTTPAPRYCGDRCRRLARATHASWLYPWRCAAGEATAEAADSTAPSPAFLAALSQALLHLSANQWTTGLRALRLYSKVLGRLQTHLRCREAAAEDAAAATVEDAAAATAEDAAAATVEDAAAATALAGPGGISGWMEVAATLPAGAEAGSWWSRLADDDWRFALSPWSSFARPSYSAANGGTDPMAAADKQAPVAAPEEPSAATPEAVDAEGDDEDAEPELAALLHGLLGAMVDARHGAGAAETLCPLGLLDRLLGAMASNTQLLGVVPAPVLLAHELARTGKAKDAAAAVAEWSAASEPLSGNEELAAAALITGMFPWHACLNHSCRPNAYISGSMDCQDLIKSIKGPFPRVLAPCVYVVCSRDIAAGEEITISYADELTPSPGEYAAALQRVRRKTPLGDSEAAPSAKLAAAEALLGREIEARFGWACLCSVCTGRSKRQANKK